MLPDALRPEEQIVVDEGCWGGEGTVVRLATKMNEMGRSKNSTRF